MLIDIKEFDCDLKFKLYEHTERACLEMKNGWSVLSEPWVWECMLI